MPRRSQRKRKIKAKTNVRNKTKRNKNSDTPAANIHNKKKRKRKPSRSRQQIAPDTPPIIVHTKQRQQTPELQTVNTPLDVVSPEMHMCSCGLLHTDVSVITASHNAHDKDCKLHNSESPSCPMPAFTPTTNQHLKRRNRDNTKELEKSAFTWVQRWLLRNKMWPNNSFPWVQWAMTHHPQSQFIWCAGSTRQQVTARASDFAERFSQSRRDFSKHLKAWWDNYAIVLLPLRNRAFKPVCAIAFILFSLFYVYCYCYQTYLPFCTCARV